MAAFCSTCCGNWCNRRRGVLSTGRNRGSRVARRRADVVDRIFGYIKERFPEIEFVDIIDTPDCEDSKTIIVKAPKDDDMQFDIMETASDVAMDILLESGQHFLVMPVSDLEEMGILS